MIFQKSIRIETQLKSKIGLDSVSNFVSINFTIMLHSNLSICVQDKYIAVNNIPVHFVISSLFQTVKNTVAKVFRSKLLEVEGDEEAQEIIDVVAGRVQGAVDDQGGKVEHHNHREVQD